MIEYKLVEIITSVEINYFYVFDRVISTKFGRK